MNIKSDWNVPNAATESMVDLFGELISMFNQNGRVSKKCGKRGFTNIEMQSIVTHILLNCPEIQPYLTFKLKKFLGTRKQIIAVYTYKVMLMVGLRRRLYCFGVSGLTHHIEAQRDKADWWIVIKTNIVGGIKIDNVLDVAYQNDVAIVHQQVDDALETTLQHPQHTRGAKTVGTITREMIRKIIGAHSNWNGGFQEDSCEKKRK
ncbi:hypothetical protein H5410_045738 [Solanum commersonii]|uniref:Uncharacterized protein n=1 Tax=Solanum commersonii TaxID=4109 RepID=A0A9J5XEJ4_SOLCO|nr:hypothetical protein H5410_045738 [Solanum commersonii]